MTGRTHNPHEPKIAALIALDEGLLHPPGRRRIERHLAGCAVCREALAAMKVADKLTAEARDQKWPEPRWEKMELALAREAKQVATKIQSDRTSARWAWGGMLAAAAAVLLVVGVETSAPVEPGRGRHGHTIELATVEIDGAVITGSVTAVAGDVRIDGHGAEPGSELHEGERVDVGSSGARMHARLAPSTGLVGMPGTAFDVLRLREHAVVLGLASGEVASQVRHLETGERYEVQVGDYLVHVRGTRFAVHRTGDDVGVTVDEGFVEVTRGTEVIAVVHAPGVWRSAPNADAASLGGVAIPHALELDALDWPVVTLPADVRVHAWVVDGQPFESGGVLRMREPVGPLSVMAFDMHGVRQTFTLDVGADGAELSPSMLHIDGATTQQAAVRPRSRTLTPDEVRTEITPLVRDAAHQDAIRRCYNTWANFVNYGAPGSVSARVTIDPAGAVTRSDLDFSSLQEAHLPRLDMLQSCIAPKISTWTFPAQTERGDRIFTVSFHLNVTH